MLRRTREQFLPGGMFNPIHDRGRGYDKNGNPLGFKPGHSQVGIPGRRRKRGLTVQQNTFVQEYVQHGNARKAAHAAGYGYTSAEWNSQRMLNHPAVAAEIAKVQEDRRIRHEITADRIIEELAKVAFANVLDYVRPTASGDPYVDFSSLTRDDAAALNISIEKSVEGYGDNTREIVRTKYTMQDKMSALRDLARHFGLFNDRGNTIDDVRGDPHTALIDAVNRLATRQLEGGGASFARREDGEGTSVQLEVVGETEPATAPGDD